MDSMGTLANELSQKAREAAIRECYMRLIETGDRDAAEKLKALLEHK